MKLPKASLLDRCYQVFFCGAFKLVRAIWFVRNPDQHGALVMIWHQNRVLLIQNSYQSHWSAPGGTIERGEKPDAAAAREMREEIGVHVSAEELRFVDKITLPFNYRNDCVRIFEWHPASTPTIRIDHREVVDAKWFTPEETQSLKLVPHIARYLVRASA